MSYHLAGKGRKCRANAPDYPQLLRRRRPSGYSCLRCLSDRRPWNRNKKATEIQPAHLTPDRMTRSQSALTARRITMPAINIGDFAATLTIDTFDHNQGVEHPDASGLSSMTRSACSSREIARYVSRRHHFKRANRCYWQQVRKMILPYNSLTPNCYDFFVAD